MPPDVKPQCPLLLPYRAYAPDRGELVTMWKTFDGPHAVAQVWGVMEIACEILDQLRNSPVSDIGDGLERISTATPIVAVAEARFGPAYDETKVSDLVAMAAVEAVKALLERVARDGGYPEPDVGWSMGQTFVSKVTVESRRVRRALKDALTTGHQAEACIHSWYGRAIEQLHGEACWPRGDFVGWYLAQPQPDGR